MKVIKHGIFYEDEVKVKCTNCDCQYLINKNDIKTYTKPIKVCVRYGDNCCTEKRNYYSICPDCGFTVPATNKEYEILTTNIKEMK